MLEKLFEAYALSVSIMITKWINYISTNLREIIHKISQFLKTDLFEAIIYQLLEQHSTGICMQFM